ncbi:terepressin/terephysin [Daphnia magna]|uniref:Vasopressin neuropeptide preprohormone-like protein n=2 Tax=Daphnia magna TaxID=35525 RepID=A0A162S7M6_9CRUS|nr:terepressin/terephysin [Daphnia magna]KAK4008211.1 hypothetical protein OUZ56_013362 [Daphnia magna]KZS21075.1 Vasopressin neuropeptide preprohormone-like protein [Daphnia magna]
MAALWTLCLIAFSILEMTMPSAAKPCFITNCPPGGKRSGHVSEDPSSFQGVAEERPLLSHQCASCGPGGKGTCFGASLCCGSEFGCFFKTNETNICLLTNLKSSRSCDERFWQIYFKSAPCSLNGDKLDGICVADRLCCSLGQCKQNFAC